MTAAKYGVLVHGAGWVSSQHIAAFSSNPATRVVAISSRKLASAERRAAESGLTGVACYDDFAKALCHPGVDIVFICTPQHIHCENTLEACAAGKHIVLEKPIAISMAEFRQMREAVKRAGVKTVVSFVLRWNPLFRKLKRLVAEGALGKPYYVEADYLSQIGTWWSGWADTHTRSQGVSAMLVAGCHAVDALRWFAATGEFEAATPVEVFAMAGGYRKGSTTEYNPITHEWAANVPPMEYEGLEVCLVRFSNGVLGKVATNFDCVIPYRFPVRIFGDRGSVLDNHVWSPAAGGKDWADLKELQPDSSDVTHHPFQAEMDHFVHCLQQNVESHCNLEDAIRTHEIVFAAQQCYQTRQPVRLPLS